MNKPIPSEQRRYIERRYSSTETRRILDIPCDEILVKIELSSSVLTVTTLTDFREEEGDL